MAVDIRPASGAQRCLKCRQPATVEVWANGQLKTMLCQQHEDEREEHAAGHAIAVAKGRRPGRGRRHRDGAAVTDSELQRVMTAGVTTDDHGQQSR